MKNPLPADNLDLAAITLTDLRLLPSDQAPTFQFVQIIQNHAERADLAAFLNFPKTWGIAIVGFLVTYYEVKHALYCGRAGRAASAFVRPERQVGTQGGVRAHKATSKFNLANS